MTIQGPPGNNSIYPERIRGNGNASRAHQVPFTTPLPIDHLLGKLFKYLTRCARGTDTPPKVLSLLVCIRTFNPPPPAKSAAKFGRCGRFVFF